MGHIYQYPINVNAIQSFESIIDQLAVPQHIGFFAIAASLIYRYTQNSAIAFRGISHAASIELNIDFEKQSVLKDLALSCSKQTAKGPQPRIVFSYEKSKDEIQKLFTEFNEDTDIILAFAKTDKSLSVMAQPHFLSATALEHLGEHFTEWLSQLAYKPDLPLDKQSYLGPLEKAKLSDWAGKEEAYPNFCHIMQHFKEQLRRKPNDIAVIYQEKTYSYQEIDQRAQALASSLLNHFPELFNTEQVVVGLLLPRSFNALVAMMAIFMLRAAYLPLDPAYPTARLNYMLERSQVKIILTESSSSSKLNSPSVCFVNIEQIDYSKPALLPEFDYQATDPAYVIFTSGSTGNPKGVICHHQNILNRFEWYWRQFPYQVDEVTCQKASLNFVDSVWEFFCPLLKGVPIVIFEESVISNITSFIEALEHYKISRIDLSPSLLSLLLNEIEAHQYDLKQLKLWVVTGEEMPIKLARRFRELVQAKLMNRYGSTEVSSFLWYDISQDPLAGQHLPIGRPIPNLYCYVLDQNKQEVGIGIPGELYVAGVGLAIAYLNQPELTSQRFIEIEGLNPQTNRFYKTGDLVRYLSDGNLEYLGRADNVLKVKGVRVEPEEIEVVLNQFPALQQAIVKVEAIQDHSVLVAYCQAKTNIDLAQLKADLLIYLKQQLPSYFIPSKFYFVASFPLNENGKLDRKQLSPPKEPQTTESYQPKNAIETKLWAIWQNLLGVSFIAKEDDFFSLGGDSLLAISLSSRIKQQFDVEINPAEIFDSPALADLAKKIESLQQKRPASYLPHSESSPIAPMSFSQESLWFLEHYMDKPAYQVIKLFNLSGKLNIGALEQSIRQLIERHSVLRTVFLNDDSQQPKQKVLSAIPFSLQVESILHSQLDEKISQLANKTLPIANNVAWDIQLFQIDARDEYLLLIHMHHIITDDWSLSIFYRELAALYQSNIEQCPADLPKLELSYQDYSRYQQDSYRAGNYEKEIHYWKNQLKDVESLQLFPLAWESPGSKLSQTCKNSISTELQQKFEHLAQQCKLTPFMIYLAAFFILLGRYSKQSDIAIGTPIANRDLAGTEQVFGYFLNTVVIRSQLEPELDFISFLHSIKSTCIAAHRNQNLAFEKVVEAIGANRDIGNNPLFQTLFVYQNINDIEPLHLTGLSLTEIELPAPRTGFNLNFMLKVGRDNSLNIETEYRPEVFPENFIRQFNEHYARLLLQIAQQPNLSIQSYSLLSNSDSGNLFIQGPAVPIRPKTIIQLFEEQVERSPNKIALHYQSVSLSYAELKQKVDSLAGYIASIDQENSPYLPIMMERGIELVVSILAALKAGYAYVPLDPEIPTHSLAHILKETGTKLILCSSYILNNNSFLQEANFQKLLVDELRLDQKSALMDFKTSELAYVIYTSGSTGKPKGVMMSHYAVVNRLIWMRDVYGFDQSQVMLQKTPIAFDVSVGEIFLPLVVGASLHILPEGMHRDIPGLVHYIQSQGISALHFVPAYLNLFINYLIDNKISCPSINKIFSAGEALTKALETKCLTALNAKIYNVYGPTETGEATYYDCAMTHPYQSVPIGRLIYNSVAKVVDEQDQDCPYFIAGELLIGGLCVADGYLGNPELTESRFIKKAETRYYKTGDLVVQLPDQNLVFLNRMDKQIKLNGVRIEPEGIESVMMSYPGVEQVSVLLISSANHKSLAAFYVSKTLIAADALIAYLKQHLPSYAIPSAFCHLEKLPLTLNGKVDRKRLIEKFSSTIEHNESVYEPASTAAEEILLGIWQKCLPSSSFGVKQKFFELGGHSLLAMQLVLEINRLFNANFSVSWVFRNQTIKDQAAEISQSHQSHPVITFNRGPAETLFFFSPYTSSAMVYKALSGHLKAELSFSVIESMTLLEQDNATISIEALASRCIAYIKGQQAHGPYSLGGWSFGGVLAYEVARQLIQDGEVVSAVFLIDSHLIDSNSFKDKSMDPSEILFNRMPVSILNRLEQLEKAAANKLVALFKCGAGMMASYKPGLLQTKLVLIKAIKNSSDNVYSIKSDNGWKAHASDLNIIELDADHYQIIEPPCAEQVAEVINKQLQGG